MWHEEILVVDNHVLIRDALRGVLEELKGDAAVVLEAPDAREAMRQLGENPDVELVLLDLGLPDRDGFELLAELAERHPTVSVAVHSANQDRDKVIEALDLGAIGFIPKSARREVLLGAFHLIFSGGIYIPPEILERQRTAWRPRAKPDPASKAPRFGRRARAHRAADGGARPDDAGQKQQGHLPCPRSRRADGEDPRLGDPEGAEGDQPHRGGDGRRRARPRTGAGDRVGCSSRPERDGRNEHAGQFMS